MNIGVEALFTSALGLQLPWVVEDVVLDTAKRRIDFEIGCQGTTLSCPACGGGGNSEGRSMSMRLRTIAFIAVTMSLGACGGEPHNTLGQDLSLMSLIVTPKGYDGEIVCVIGYGVIEEESTVLFFSDVDYQLGNLANSVWLDLEANVVNSIGGSDKQAKGWVLVEGVFSLGDKGHMGLFAGSIINISRMEFRDVVQTSDSDL